MKMKVLKELIKSLKKTKSKVVYIKVNMVPEFLSHSDFIPISHYGCGEEKTYPIINLTGKLSKQRKTIYEGIELSEGELGTIYGKEIRVLT